MNFKIIVLPTWPGRHRGGIQSTQPGPIRARAAAAGRPGAHRRRLPGPGTGGRPSKWTCWQADAARAAAGPRPGHHDSESDIEAAHGETNLFITPTPAAETVRGRTRPIRTVGGCRAMRFKALLHRDRLIAGSGGRTGSVRHNAMRRSGSRTLRASRSSRRSAGSARCFDGLYTQTTSPCERLGFPSGRFYGDVADALSEQTCNPSLHQPENSATVTPAPKPTA